MNQTFLVTGGSQGIGAATARLAASRGYQVAFTYQRAVNLAEQVLADIRGAGGTAIAIQAEMAEEASIVSAFEQVDREFGPVDAVVSNAGITGPTGTIDKITTAVLDEVMGVNVRGAFLVIREATLRMATDLGGKGGAIVNVSSRASTLGGGGEWIHYGASKGAVDTLTVGASRELATRGIRVNAVNPGLIETDLHAKAGLPDRVQRLLGGVPLGRAGTAEECARVILWLLSDEASYVTGALVPISGGR
jgi:NAD(P)-dependent dehydrogenase (short-subunit alcohol dehydrogenase family)